MNKVCFPQWDNDNKKIVVEINRVTAQIQSVGKKLKTNDISYDNFMVFYNNVCQTLNFWTGHTYIGQEKDKSVRKAFQAFFEALYSFLFICRDLDMRMLQDLADSALYRGTLYRYLGHGSVERDIDCKVEPQYNNIYVSWSKKPKNSYIESKLYGTMTLLTCRVDEPHYGIDLNAFDVARGEEAEVVFPTIKESIIDVKYIER